MLARRKTRCCFSLDMTVAAVASRSKRAGLWRTLVVAFAMLFVVWNAVFVVRYRGGGDEVDNDDYRNTDRRRAIIDRRQKRRRRLAMMVQPSVQVNNSGGGSSASGGGGRLVDCSVSTRYCTSDADCWSMCRSYDGTVRTTCDPSTHVCILATTTPLPPPSVVARQDRGRDKNDDDDDGEEICNSKLGEYAMLVGYSSLGVARWQCVPLYVHFSGSGSSDTAAAAAATAGVRFCEGGDFDMDATRREPSYRDCACPAGTERMIKRLIDQYDIGLPHCIASGNRRFFDEDMDVVADDNDDDSESRRRRRPL